MNERLPREDGTVGILNVGSGDTKLSFDPKNPADRIRAARIVKDMLRRGYALLVEAEVNGQKVFTRALDFDESVCEYIIADFDPTAATEPQDNEEANDGQQGETVEGTAPEAAARRTKAGTRRIKAEQARSVAVARTAGG
jgi:hypothetical protein